MTIELLQGDITALTIDAIVNPANPSLLGGDGLDGLVHKKAGKALLEACVEISAKKGGCKTGEAVVTPAGKLLAKHVIHTVAPVWNGGKNKEEELLSSCYRKSLALAEQTGIKSIAFPSIGTGAYRFPKESAAAIAVAEVKAHQLKGSTIEKVIFVCFDEDSYKMYAQKLNA